MSEIDRLADKLCPILRDDGAWSSKESRRKVVRAILTAMREPSEGTIEAGFEVADWSEGQEDDEDFNRQNGVTRWQAMIDHILNQDEGLGHHGVKARDRK